MIILSNRRAPDIPIDLIWFGKITIEFFRRNWKG